MDSPLNNPDPGEKIVSEPDHTSKYYTNGELNTEFKKKKLREFNSLRTKIFIP